MDGLCEDLPDYFHRNSCRIDTEENGLLDAVALVRTVTSLLGFLGGSSIILSAIIRRRLCSLDVHPIVMLSVADCILSVLWFIGSFIWLSDLSVDSFNRVCCYPVTLSTGVMECVALNLTLVYAILAYTRTKKSEYLVPHSLLRKSVSCKAVLSMYTIAWVFPAFAILLVFGITAQRYNFLSVTQACSCWCRPTIINVLPVSTAEDEESKLYMKNSTTFAVILGCMITLQYIIVFILLLITYLKTLTKIRSLKRQYESRQNAYNYGATEILIRGESKATKRVFLFLTVFVFSGFFNVCSTILLLPVVVVLFYDNSGNGETIGTIFTTYYVFLFAQSMTLPLQGFFNAIVYGWTREDFVSSVSFPLHNEHVGDSSLSFEQQEEPTLTDSVESCDGSVTSRCTHKIQ